MILCFFQAFECYERAKLCIVERKESPHLWDKVTWELSESYFTVAILMKDFTPLSSDSYKQVTRGMIKMDKLQRKIQHFIGFHLIGYYLGHVGKVIW